MNAIKIALSALIVGAVVCSCKKKEADTPAKSAAKLDTLEKFTAEYKKCHAKGVDEVMKLVYKNDQMPEKVMKIMKESMASDAGLKVKSITTEKYDDSNDAMMTAAMAKQGMKMPVKPTNTLKVVYEQKEGVEGSTEMPIAKVDGSFYLITPVKAQ
jgi:hypothetical protein